MGVGSDPFATDAAQGGYRYTTDAPLSSRMAHGRMTDAVLAIADFKDKRVIDVGCGDGLFTFELLERGGAASVVGVDPVLEALEVARARSEGERAEFKLGSDYELDFPSSDFDIAHLRAVLHHLDRPIDALREALRVAPTVVVAEPNGNNPGVKLFERFSRYHIDHEERSYSSRALNRWARSVGGEVTARNWVGEVPTFCPDIVARVTKRIEPLSESLPGFRALACAHYVFVVTRR
jgi:ubiquinone/menaquinone biosynthesis C-methylase UbiE